MHSGSHCMQLSCAWFKKTKHHITRLKLRDHVPPCNCSITHGRSKGLVWVDDLGDEDADDVLLVVVLGVRGPPQEGVALPFLEGVGEHGDQDVLQDLRSREHRGLSTYSVSLTLFPHHTHTDEEVGVVWVWPGNNDYSIVVEEDYNTVVETSGIERTAENSGWN